MDLRIDQLQTIAFEREGEAYAREAASALAQALCSQMDAMRVAHDKRLDEIRSAIGSLRIGKSEEYQWIIFEVLCAFDAARIKTRDVIR